MPVFKSVPINCVSASWHFQHGKGTNHRRLFQTFHERMLTPLVCSHHLDPPGVGRQVEAASTVIVAVAGHHRAVVEVGREEERVPQHPADDGLHLRLSASPQLLLTLAFVSPCGECTV